MERSGFRCGSGRPSVPSDLITNAQQALVAMVKDWNYDYGAEQALLRDVAWDGPEASSRGKH